MKSTAAHRHHLDTRSGAGPGDLPSLRARIVALNEQRRSLINAPPQPSEAAFQVKEFVAELAKKGKPSQLMRDGAGLRRAGAAV